LVGLEILALLQVEHVPLHAPTVNDVTMELVDAHLEPFLIPLAIALQPILLVVLVFFAMETEFAFWKITNLIAFAHKMLTDPVQLHSLVLIVTELLVVIKLAHMQTCNACNPPTLEFLLSVNADQVSLETNAIQPLLLHVFAQLRLVLDGLVTTLENAYVLLDSKEIDAM